MREVMVRLMMLGMMLLLVVGGPRVGAANPDLPAAGPNVDLYLAMPDGGTAVPLDSATLAERVGAPGIDLGEAAGNMETALSADGSTLVAIEFPRDVTVLSGDDVTIVVRDARSGEERARFHPPVAVERPRLSHDGARLVVDRRLDAGPATLAWYVFDTRDGRLTATVPATDGWVETTLDPEARRLYYFVWPSSRMSDGRVSPPLVQLVAYDLTTGAEVGRQLFPELWGGYQGNMHEPNATHALAGLAVSPDGATLAVARVDQDAITLIDAETLEVQRTIGLTMPTSLRDRLRGFFSLAPQSAEAKFSEGITLFATFSPDGRHLYVYGSEEHVEEEADRAWGYGIGLKVVDVESGQIVAESLEDELIEHVFPAPDGTTLYVVGPTGGRSLRIWETEPADYTRSFVVRRLDAMTLETLAEREFNAYPSLLLVAS